MQPTRLVVLASGMGSRLRFKASPKPLVELGGISLVERALAGARQAGFDEVVAVTGHRADQIDRHVLEVSRRRGIAVTVVRNERYREGNGLSALAARDRVGYDPFAGACWRRHGGRVFSRPVRPAPTVATKVPPRAQTPGTSEGQGSAITDRRRVSWSAIEIAGGWAETSQRLSNEERDELVRLRKKARNRRTPLTKAEQAKYASLVVKAVGTERVRDWLDRQSSPASESPRAIREVNAAERLKTAADLRDAGVITEDDFQALKVRYLEEL